MEKGKNVKTSLGDSVVLFSIDSRYGKYVILFNGNKFIKASNYYIENDFVYWGNGQVYDSFLHLCLDITEEVDGIFYS